jgi:hypothetical protein
MTSHPDKNFWSEIGTWIVKAYKVVREPVCYLLVVITLIASILQNEKVLLTSLAILLGILVRILFEVHAHTERQGGVPVRYKNITVAAEKIEACLRAAQKHDGYVRIRWLGMTMSNVWSSTMEGIFDTLAHERGFKLLFDVAMLDAAWLEKNPTININWTGTIADQNACKIQNFRAINHQLLAGQEWEFRIHRYSHMPAVHGGLINERYLFLGIARWEEGTMKAGDRTYYYFAARDGQEAQELIEVFENWFHFCFGDKPARPTPLPPAVSAALSSQE